MGLEIRRLSPFDTSNTDIDVVFDLMIHDVDMVLSLLGDDIRHIHAHGRHARTTGVDYAVANMSFGDGSIATLTASRVTEQKVRIIEITTIGAYLEADLLNKSISIYRRANARVSLEPPEATSIPAGRSGGTNPHPDSRAADAGVAALRSLRD